ncbi:two-component system response regulator [Clostridia bacterium]|nr:two-component system response regulator [Clostridia bacterium]
MRKSAQKPVLKYKILVVDDEQGVIDSLIVVLGKSGYTVQGITDPYEAVDLLRREHFDMLILDFLMSPIHGDRVVELIREFDKDLYILLLTGYKDLVPPIETVRTLDIQGYCEKSNRFEQLVLLVESGMKSVMRNAELNEALAALQEHYLETIEALRVVVNTKDHYTRCHSDRVTYYAMKIGQAMGLDEESLETLNVGCRFHDIGKIGVPDSILLKPDRLGDEEFLEIKKHPANGAHILSVMSVFQKIIPLVKSHHERIDGKGYPDGLSGAEIPFLARIVSVADSFDAMTSDRAYRSKMELDKAIEQLRQGISQQFDGDIVNAFIELLSSYDEMEEEIAKMER